jgi:hypothetical protein
MPVEMDVQGIDTEEIYSQIVKALRDRRGVD